MVNYYKEHNEIPSIPIDIAQECISHGLKCLEQNIPMIAWYKRYETVNTNSVSYMQPGKEFEESNGEESGGVGFFTLPLEIRKKIKDFYSQFDIPIVQFDDLYLQVVTGGKFVGPHVDDVNCRKEGMLYLLKSGGTNVRTIWYKIKPEYKNLTLENYTVIPYSKLDVVEDHCLTENTWHYLNFSEIHGVINQDSVRMALWGHNL